MPSAQAEKLAAMLRSQPSDANVAVEVLRRGLEAVAGMFSRVPQGSISPGVVGNVPGEWLTPPDVVPGRHLLYLHGGAYLMGSPLIYRSLVWRLSKRLRARAFTPDYRLAPEHRFPAAIMDALAVFRGMIADGVDPAQLTVAGDSAGGGLTLALMMAQRDVGEPLPRCAAIFSPWTDLAVTGSTIQAHARFDAMLSEPLVRRAANDYLGNADPRDPLASPLYGDFTGLPPLLVQVSSSEMLRDDAERVAEKADAAGIEVTLGIWEDMVHAWHFFAALAPEGADALNEAADWMLERLEKQPHD